MDEHISVLLTESIDGLNIKEDGIYVDATLGRAGHSSHILSKLSGKGKLYCFDKDNDAMEVSRKRLSAISPQFELIHADFKNLKEELVKRGVSSVDGILFDLGVSSPQLDNGERGFSYKYDARLDMRMNRDDKLDAYTVVNTYKEEDLRNIIYSYGEERYARNIARNIVLRRKEKPIETTFELVDIIKSGMPGKALKDGHPAKRTFQAIRIEVNNEIEPLYNTIIDSIDCLKSGGRLCVITFHSLEDRAVKNAFVNSEGACTCPKDLPYCVCKKEQKGKVITTKDLVILITNDNINRRIPDFTGLSINQSKTLLSYLEKFSNAMYDNFNSESTDLLLALIQEAHSVFECIKSNINKNIYLCTYNNNYKEEIILAALKEAVYNGVNNLTKKGKLSVNVGIYK